MQIALKCVISFSILLGTKSAGNLNTCTHTKQPQSDRQEPFRAWAIAIPTESINFRSSWGHCKAEKRNTEDSSLPSIWLSTENRNAIKSLFVFLQY